MNLLRHWLGFGTAYVAVFFDADSEEDRFDEEAPPILRLSLELGDGIGAPTRLDLLPTGLPQDLADADKRLALIEDAAQQARAFVWTMMAKLPTPSTPDLDDLLPGDPEPRLAGEEGEDG